MTLTLEAPRTMTDRPTRFNMADLVSEQVNDAAPRTRRTLPPTPAAPTPEPSPPTPQDVAHAIHGAWLAHGLTHSEAKFAFVYLLRAARQVAPWAVYGILRTMRACRTDYQLHRRPPSRWRHALTAKRQATGEDSITTWLAHRLAVDGIGTQAPTQQRREAQQRQPGASALLALNVPQQRSTPPTPARPPLGRTRTRTVHDDFTGQSRRDRERRARQYASEWYHAIREWAVQVTYEETMPRREGASTGEGRMRPIVGNWASRPLSVQERLLQTPWRPLPEGRVAPLINTSDVLTAIRDGRTLAHLGDPRGGWHQHRATALSYAHAVLTLAWHLGDPRAHEHLRALPAPLAQTQQEP